MAACSNGWYGRIASAVMALGVLAGGAAGEPAPVVDGYRGIWFTLGQRSEHGDKYSGGLGTYTANHLPVAVYAKEVEKTFFVYGGTPAADERRLLIMASYFDHRTGTVPRPRVVHDKSPVNDPHDNAAINLDAEGYLWVFVSGRARGRPGLLYRSVRPYDIAEFELVDKREMTYPQAHYVAGRGFFYLFTKYTKGRELYFQTSGDGRVWSEETKLAGMGGHYQVSGATADGSVVGSAFMYHPGGNVDRRTNLYYVETRDWGKSWRTAGGKPLELPLASVRSEALVVDYEARGRNVYIHDLRFDAEGRPVVLYLTSGGHKPGPASGPFTWVVTRFDGREWETHEVAASDHSYDTGSLTIEGKRWTVMGPTGKGPYPFATGGEVRFHESRDAGRTWKVVREVTRGSVRNHSYVRPVVNGREPFSYFWADGHPHELSESVLYFCDSEGRKVYELPYTMTGETGRPRAVERGE